MIDAKGKLTLESPGLMTVLKWIQTAVRRGPGLQHHLRLA